MVDYLIWWTTYTERYLTYKCTDLQTHYSNGRRPPVIFSYQSKVWLPLPRDALLVALNYIEVMILQYNPLLNLIRSLVSELHFPQCGFQVNKNENLFQKFTLLVITIKLGSKPQNKYFSLKIINPYSYLIFYNFHLIQELFFHTRKYNIYHKYQKHFYTKKYNKKKLSLNGDRLALFQFFQNVNVKSRKSINLFLILRHRAAHSVTSISKHKYFFCFLPLSDLMTF